MSDLRDLTTLIAKVRQRADMESTQFCTDSEITGYIQDAWRELYDLLVEAVEDYSFTTTSFTISSGNTYSLPGSFYKLRGLDDLSDPNNPVTVRKFLLGERNDYSARDRLAGRFLYSDVFYRIEGGNLVILPSDKAARPYQLMYVPTPTIPVLGADTIDVINGFDKYIIADAAMQCLTKEESDITAVKAEKAYQLERITKMRASRDQNLPERVTRVRSSRSNWWGMASDDL